jgi:hypothetical protein
LDGPNKDATASRAPTATATGLNWLGPLRSNWRLKHPERQYVHGIPVD